MNFSVRSVAVAAAAVLHLCVPPSGILVTALAIGTPHPSSTSLLGHAFERESWRRAAVGANEGIADSWHARGTIQAAYAGLRAPTSVVAATTALQRFGDGREQHVTWLGWNNILLNRVTRYLIVAPRAVGASGADGAAECYTYEEPNPRGCFDPMQLLTSRYDEAGVDARGDPQYVYSWRLQGLDGMQQMSLLTQPVGQAPTRALMNVTRAATGGVGGGSGGGGQGERGQGGGGTVATYRFDYGRPKAVDWGLFYAYEGLECLTVANFTAPHVPEQAVCADSWLALEYECA